MNKIVLATDFSDHANNALEYAVALASEMGAELILFHSVGIPTTNTDMLVNPLSLLEKIAYDRLKQIEVDVAKAIQEHSFPVIQVRSVVKAGFPSENIIQFAAEEKADLLVVGTHGVSSGNLFLKGSTSAEVARRAKCPVLAVPTDTQARPISKIVFAADLGGLSKTTFKPVEIFADAFDSEVRVVHVIPPSEHFSPSKFEEYKAGFREKCNAERISFHLFETEYNRVAEAIHDYSEFEGADLVVMTSRPRNLIKRLFNPSETSRMCLKSSVPLLILHGN
jgi:nucleotide-binding universal stress UspA family protein